MKAWMAPMAMSKSFQTTVKGTDRMPPMGSGPELPDDQGGQQGEHEAAGEQVAEQTEGQGDRLDQLLDHVHEQVDREQLGGERLGEVVLDVPASRPGS